MQGHRRFFLHPSPPPLPSNFCFPPLEFSPCPSRTRGIYARNVSFYRIWLKIWSLVESVSYFLKGKNKIISPINNPLQSCVHGVSNISLLPNYPCNTCHSQSKLHFSLEKKYIYLYTPPKFLRFESPPILDRSKDVPLTIIHEWNRSHDSHWGLVERDSPRINMHRATYRIGIVGSSFFPCILPPPPLLCVSVTRIIVSIHRSIDRRPAN